MNYCVTELVNMVYSLGEAHGNCLLAARLYKANNPNLERFPRTDCFEKVKERFEITANANYVKITRIHENSNEENQIAILGSVIENPNASVRQVGREVGVSKSLVNKTLKKNKFHPYHIQTHQSLSEQDFQNRFEFCHWAIEKIREDRNFFSNVLFTDESSFSSICRAYRHNFHHYSDHNPRLLRKEDRQHRFKVNVWAGICGNYIVGPYFFENNLTGTMYLQFLQNSLNELQRHIPEDILVRQWFQQDGAPPHSTLAIRQYLNQTYPNKWIGRGGPVTWPARSPDLSCLDFFLWGYVKQRVYQEVPLDIDHLKLRIRNAFLSVTPEMLRNVVNNFEDRIMMCIEENGGYFEQLM